MGQSTNQHDVSRLRRFARHVTSLMFAMATAVLLALGLTSYTHYCHTTDLNRSQFAGVWQLALSNVQQSLAREHATTRQMARLISDHLEADDPPQLSEMFTFKRLQTLVDSVRHQAQQTETDLSVLIALSPKFDDPQPTKYPTVRIVAHIRTSHPAAVQLAQTSADLWGEQRPEDAGKMLDALDELLTFLEKQSGALQYQTQKLSDTASELTQARTLIAFWGQTVLTLAVGCGLTWAASGGVRQRLRNWRARKKTSSSRDDDLEAEQADLTGRSILVVDDGHYNRRLLGTLVAQCGARISCAADGQQAVEMVLFSRLAGQQFDLVLMDIMMPVMDGIVATRKLRQAGYEGIVIAVTASYQDDVRKTCLEAGCNDFLGKPLQRHDLMRLLAKYLNSPSGDLTQDAAAKELTEPFSAV